VFTPHGSPTHLGSPPVVPVAPVAPVVSKASRRRRPAAAVLLAVAVPLAAGCASTTYDETLATSATTAVATTTTLPTGTADELLERLRAEAASLSTVMIDEGDDDAVVARISALWDAASREVGATRPDLSVSFENAVALSRKAVQFGRAADADKASLNFDALVDAYLLG
jgi:hypothetical protein